MEHLRSPALIPKTLGFNGDIGLEAYSEAGAVREIDLKVGAIAPIFKDGAQLDDLSCEFFAFNHGFDLSCQNYFGTVSSFEHCKLSPNFGEYHTHRV